MADGLERFGRNVREARAGRGWTQEDLAGRTGLSPVQISRIERGVREVRLSTLVKLTAGLGVDANTLLAGVKLG